MSKMYRDQLSLKRDRRARSTRPALVTFLGVAVACWFTFSARAQTATIADAWWTYQQDCNGDGCYAGTLLGNFARLNWDPDVTNCNGTLTVFEIVYTKACGDSTWTPVFTNAEHTIVGCRSIGQQFADIPLSNACACVDYQIEIYRSGETAPDYTRSPDNDPDLAQHKEQWLEEDFCASDFFASCVSIVGGMGTESDDNTYATKEPDEPDHAGNPGGHSLWYCWVATNNAPVTFDTLGSSFDTLLAVYTGDSFSNLTLVAANDDIDGPNNRRSRVSFTPEIGTTYRIAVDGFGGGEGLVTLNWNQTGAALPDLVIWGPSVMPTVIVRTFTNDDCEVLEGCETPGTHTLLSFSTETRNIGAGDLILGDPATNSLFIWASCHEHFHFEHYAEYNLLDTNGNVVATGHKVGFCLLDDEAWSPDANPARKYDCNNQGIQAGWSDVYAAGLPCQYIDITGVPPGDYVLQMVVNPDNLITEADTSNNTTLVPVTIPPPGCLSTPANDDFAAALLTTNFSASYSALNNCATKEADEPDHAGTTGGHSLWFAWTANSNQTAHVTTKRSDFDTVLAVYTGDSLTNLSLVVSNDDINPGFYIQSEVYFDATEGTTYYFAVDGYESAVGTAVLNLNPPDNDDYHDAFEIFGTAGTTNGTTIGASKEPYELAHAFDVGGHSIWYRWTAPVSGPVDFDTHGSSYNTTMAVYTGGMITNNTLVAANNDDTGGLVTSRVGFNAVEGTVYDIAIDGFGGAAGSVTLNWNMDSALAIAPLPGGHVHITLTGVNWQRYGLLSSTDLLTWTTNVPPITLFGGAHHYTNDAAFDRVFYRAVLVP